MLSPHKILILEDNPLDQMLLKNAMKGLGDLVCVDTVDQARALVESQSFSLYLLDVNLPDGDGFRFCRYVRETLKQDTPILFITSKGSKEDTVFGLTAGGDDYLVKPFNKEELRARIALRMKKHHANQPAENVKSLASDGLILNLQRQALSIEINGSLTEIELTPIEFKMLCTLIENQNQVITIERLKDEVWGTTFIEKQSIYTHMSHLKRKLKPYSSRIKSAYGKGYVYKAAS